MQNKTTEFSFVLKISDHEVGIFAVHDIKSGTYLRLFGDKDYQNDVSVIREKKDVPEFFRSYCIDRGDTMLCPSDFGRMEIFWYINHSKTPNAHHRNYEYCALRNIKAGEEITIDYNTLEEPEENKEDYYKER